MSYIVYLISHTFFHLITSLIYISLSVSSIYIYIDIVVSISSTTFCIIYVYIYMSISIPRSTYSCLWICLHLYLISTSESRSIIYDRKPSCILGDCTPLVGKKCLYAESVLLQAVTLPCLFKAYVVSSLQASYVNFRGCGQPLFATVTVLTNQVRRSFVCQSKKLHWFFYYLNILINLFVLIMAKGNKQKRKEKESHCT